VAEALRRPVLLGKVPSRSSSEVGEIFCESAAGGAEEARRNRSKSQRGAGPAPGVYCSIRHAHGSKPRKVEAYSPLAP
jgi:hypothetical protein